MLSGIELIAAERKRQIEQEGFSSERDAKYRNDELVRAAVAYAINPYPRLCLWVDRFWPWDKSWWKPSYRDAIRDLTKAGALIAAEIDRIQETKRGSSDVEDTASDSDS